MNTVCATVTQKVVAECKGKGIASLLVKEFEETGKVTARSAFSAMKQGDAAGKEVVDEFISYLVCGLANMINIFQPEILSIGGGVCNEGDYLLKPLLEKIDGETYGSSVDKPKTKLLIAKLGNDAGIIGGAALGLK